MIFSDFLAGVTMATFAASGVFFLKFWRASRDRFYLLFSLACWLLALDRTTSVAVGISQQALRSVATESSSWVYLIRLVAYLMILFAIIEKNRSTGRR